ncbi:MAG: VWA domain-containing protein [Caldilineaceae bacterium]
MGRLPGGALASRPLHFFWIVDCSGSMAGKKIQELNFAIREAIPEMQRVALENPNAQVLVRAITFANHAQWHIAQPTPIRDFRWSDMRADGVTDMGRALRMVADQLTPANMSPRGLPPVLVLISDGRPTDDYNSGLRALLDQQWGKKAVRIAIAIGNDADLDVLQKFIGHPELTPLVAHNAPDLVKYIRWASTAVLKSASSPTSQAVGQPTPPTNAPLPAAPVASPFVEDVW